VNRNERSTTKATQNGSEGLRLNCECLSSASTRKLEEEGPLHWSIRIRVVNNALAIGLINLGTRLRSLLGLD
jgi:hypothetical protein